jgi:hypothetical protein
MRVSVSLSVCVSICMSVCLSVYLSACLCVCVTKIIAGDPNDPLWRNSDAGRAAYARFMRATTSTKKPPPPEVLHGTISLYPPRHT